jgi:hypothetical protein
MTYLFLPTWRGVLDTTLCDVWFTTGRCNSPGTPISSTNKTDRHDRTEIWKRLGSGHGEDMVNVSSTKCDWLIDWLVFNSRQFENNHSSIQSNLIKHKQELLTLPEHLSSPPVFGGVRVTRSLVLCVCFVDRCLSFCTDSDWSFGIFKLLLRSVP